MRKVYLIGALFLCFVVSVNAQTAATYSFTAFSVGYSPIGSGGTFASGILGDDQTQRGISLGFTFNYCGTNYTTVSACSNGWLSLTNSSATVYSNTASGMPYSGTTSGSGIGAGVLMPFWDDLNCSGDSASYQTTGTAPNRVFTFEWRRVHTYGASGVGYFQVKLHETSNIVQFCYGSSSFSGTSATIGIANSTTDYKTLSSSGSAPAASSATFTTSISASPATGQVYQWTPCQVTVTAASDAPVCPGATLHLTGSSTGTRYLWSGPAGFTATTASAVITAVTPAHAGIYTLTASDSTCSVVATTAVTLSIAPPAPVITPSVAAICNGGNQMLTAFVPLVTTNILSQDFNAGIAGWTVTNTGSSSVQWMVRPDGYTYSSAFHSPDASNFIVANPDAYTGVTTTVLTSPTFSLAGYSAATLSFQHYYRYYSGDYYAMVEISTNGGSTWSTITDYRTAATTVGGFTTFAAASFNLSAYLGYSNCKIRYNYSSNWGYYWAIDNILIAGMPVSAPVATWAPATGLYTNAALTVPYTSGTATDTVFAHYTTVATSSAYSYIATVTNGTCTSADTASITVTNTVPAITGPAAVCEGSSVTLANASAGGTWTVADPSVATIDAMGSVTGIAAGTTTVYYETGGCLGFRNITVNAAPAASTGTTVLCAGSTALVSNTTPGGNWSSSNTTVATIDTTGMVNGIAAGTTSINYTLPTGCSSSLSVTVNPLPAAISGRLSICSGGDTSTLYSATSGGTWGSSNPSVARISATGLVSSYGPGTSVITYTLGTGCPVTATLTVNPLPADITGTTVICQGYGSVLSDATTGGTWSSSNAGIASVNAATGYVFGVGAGSATISYTSPAHCAAFTTVTVHPVVVPVVHIAVSPGFIVRAGTTVTFTATVTGGGYTPTYQWYINGATVGGASGPVFITSSIRDKDSVSCQVVNHDQCNGIAGFAYIIMTIGNNVGVTGVQPKQTALTIAPNPASSAFTLAGYAGFEEGELNIEILASDGSLVHSGKAQVHMGQISELIQVDLPSGVYVVRVREGNNGTVLRLVINR